MITVDNSKERQEIKLLFERGDHKFNNGSTHSEKEEGLKYILQGLKKLKILFESSSFFFNKNKKTILIKEEPDKQMVLVLQKLYSERYKDLEEKLKLLENQKKPVAMKAGGGGGGDKNDEDKKFQDSLSEAIVTEKPNIKWEDVAGLENAKKALQEAVILPIKFPQIFVGARKPWKGILLYGPPGTGKTFLAKACATECEGTFFSVSSSDLISKYVGESEKLIKTLFKMAREKRPAIIFIDEIDSLCGSRSDGENDSTRRVKTEFLVQMQGVGKDEDGLLVLGATNLPWGLDPAMRRRFERRIYIPLPDYDGRLFLVKNNFAKTPNNLKEEDFAVIAKEIEGFSGSDISVFVRDAVFEPVRKIQNAQYFQEIKTGGKTKYKPVDDTAKNLPNVKKISLVELTQDQLQIPEVSMDDVRISLARAKPSVATEQLKDYENFTTQFGQDG